MSDVFTNQEVLVAHANARLNLHGRRLLVERVIHRRPVSHVAKELGISRQCAHRWIAWFRAEGEAGLADRSSRPRTCPRQTSVEIEQRVLELRRTQRRGQDWIGPEVGLAPRTVSAILRRHRVPYLRECDALTGDLIHLDVKKNGRIPPGGGWRAHGRAATVAQRHKRTKIGLTTSTSRSTTTLVWPTPRSCPTRPDPPARASCSGPLFSSPATASRSARSSPTTPATTPLPRLQ